MNNYSVKKIIDVNGFIVDETTLLPGDSEYSFTKGHKHINTDCHEVYYGVSGVGVLLLEKAGCCELLTLAKGQAHIVRDESHRVINTGSTNLVFLTLRNAEAGHDYNVEFATRL